MPKNTALFAVSLGILAAAGSIASDRREASRPVAGIVSRSAPAAAPNFGIQTLASNLTSITSIVHAGDTRLFLTLQTGRIVVYEAGLVLPPAFLDVMAEVSCCGERGLLSVAFHPMYAANGFFFINYTNRVGDTVIARYRVSQTNGNLADPMTRRVLMTIPQPFANHNGGELQFGPDGYLYIGMGDGGSANDPSCVAQRDDTPLGKMLRIDVNQNVDEEPYHGIPADNPFVGPSDPLDSIWAKGLRNPWRFSFDRLTGDLWIADVGQGAREEVNFQPRASRGGENYGWKFMEGTQCTGNSSGCSMSIPCGSSELTGPTYEYAQGMGECSVTGGYVYRGSEIPELRGLYVYGDYCSGRIWAATRLLTPRVRQLTTFGEDVAGELYLGTETGLLLRAVNPNPITPTPAPPPERDVTLAPRPPRTPGPVQRP